MCVCVCVRARARVCVHVYNFDFVCGFVCSGLGGNVQQPGGSVHLPVEQAGAQAMGPGGLPLP